MTAKLDFNKNFSGLQILWDAAIEREWYDLKDILKTKSRYTTAESIDGHGKKHRYKYRPYQVTHENSTIKIAYQKAVPPRPKAWRPASSWLDATAGTTTIYLKNELPYKIEWRRDRAKTPKTLKYGKEWVYYPYDLSHLIFDHAVTEILNSGVTKKPKGNPNPKKLISLTPNYQRDTEVAAWAIQQANGRCQRCQQEAPFRTRDGRPYLEVHHKKHLAEGGSDTTENVVALCPNCHRNEHYGERRFF